MSFESRVLLFENLVDEMQSKMPLIEQRIFNGEYVYPDFNRYHKCTFADHTLVFGFGLCAFANCDFSRCRFEAKPGSPVESILMFDKQVRDSAFTEKNR